MTDGKGGSSGPVVAGRLIEDVGEVVGHSFLAQSQCLGDLPIAFPLGNQLEHGVFAVGQVGREWWGEWLTRLVRKGA